MDEHLRLWAKPTSKSDYKLPKSAMELIATAILECGSSHPTVTQIATYIHDNMPTYRDLELDSLVKMVTHHLTRYGSGVFVQVPEISSQTPGHRTQNAESVRWTVNRKALVAQERSRFRCRYQPYSYRYPAPSLVTTQGATRAFFPPSSLGSASTHLSISVRPPVSFHRFPSSSGTSESRYVLDGDHTTHWSPCSSSEDDALGTVQMTGTCRIPTIAHSSFGWHF